MVMWKPTGRIRRLAARSTPSVINPGRRALYFFFIFYCVFKF